MVYRAIAATSLVFILWSMSVSPKSFFMVRNGHNANSVDGSS